MNDNNSEETNKNEANEIPAKPSFLALRKSHPDHEENKKRMQHWTESDGDKIWLKGNKTKAVTPTISPEEQKPVRQFYDDGFDGEIVMKRTEAVETKMRVSITQVSETDYTEEMPIGEWIEIVSIKALAQTTDAVIEKVNDITYTLTCEWGNGEGEDVFQVEIK